MPLLLQPNAKVLQKTLSMMLTVPQVMASRIWMYADPSQHSLSNLHDEYHLMFSEKQYAFFESVNEAQHQLIDSHLQIANEWIGSWQTLLFGCPDSFHKLNSRIEQETLKIIDKSITPYAQRVKANNKRLNGELNG